MPLLPIPRLYPHPTPPNTDTRTHAFTHILTAADLTVTDRLYTPWHQIAGFRWRLLIFPHGNGCDSYLSLYLDCGGPWEIPTESPSLHNVPRPDEAGWKLSATFSLHLSKSTSPVADHALNNHPYPARLLATSATHDLVKETSHDFRASARDWGFLEFAPRTMLLPGEHADSDGNVVLHVIISLPGTFSNRLHRDSAADVWPSRAKTGYVGLVAHSAAAGGATNALAHTLFLVGAVRRAVLRLPVVKPDEMGADLQLESDATSDEEKQEERRVQCIKHEAKRAPAKTLHALQVLFADLLFAKRVAVSYSLAKAFGAGVSGCHGDWLVFSFHELKMRLFARLRERGGNGIEELDRVFRGDMKRKVKCDKVDYETETEEAFDDVILNVAGCRDVQESFRKFVQPEFVEGAKGIIVEGSEGRQAAWLCTEFVRFPDVLQLMLNRARFDEDSGSMIKVNDRYEFPLELDLRPFVEEGSTGGDNNVYVLHAVVAHRGELGDDSVCVYARPELADEEDGVGWLRFEDRVVSRCTAEEAVEGCFGHGGQFDEGGREGGHAEEGNAWVLQYVRKSEIKRLLVPMSRADVPRELLKSIREERL